MEAVQGDSVVQHERPDWSLRGTVCVGTDPWRQVQSEFCTLHADGTITSTDEAYSKLLLWIDSNHDGLSSLSELLSLSQAGIARLDTSNVTRRRRDQYGNRYRYEGTEQPRGANRSAYIKSSFFAAARSPARERLPRPSWRVTGMEAHW